MADFMLLSGYVIWSTGVCGGRFLSFPQGNASFTH